MSPGPVNGRLRQDNTITLAGTAAHQRQSAATGLGWCVWIEAGWTSDPAIFRPGDWRPPGSIHGPSATDPGWTTGLGGCRSAHGRDCGAERQQLANDGVALAVLLKAIGQVAPTEPVLLLLGFELGAQHRQA